MKLNLAFYYQFVCVLWIVSHTMVQAQDEESESAETNQTTVSELFEKISERVTPYGKIYLGLGANENGEVGVANGTPRVGLKLHHSIFKDDPDKLKVIGRVELGLNLVSRDESIIFSPDPGTAEARANDAVFTRLGYLGFSYRDLSFTFGKDNSVYYLLGAEEVDQALAFGGEAIGVWNAEGDGGISGTGRPNQVITVKYEGEHLKIGVQAQARNISENNETFDTYGFGINYSVGGFGIGLGYNKVLDGVEDPEINQAAEDDEAFVVSASYEWERFVVAGSYHRFSQHEIVTLEDGEDIFYDGEGVEVYLKYLFTPSLRWHVATVLNLLYPQAGQDLGDYNFRFGVLELAYRFEEDSYVFLTNQIDFSKDIDGSDRLPSVFGLGVEFAF